MKTLDQTQPDTQFRTGIVTALAAFLIWGFLPPLFRAIGPVSPFDILAGRIIWACFFIACAVTIFRRWGSVFETVRNPRLLLLLAASGLSIGLNWLFFVLSVQHGRVTEISIGYFMNPLLTLVMAALFLKERFTFPQGIAVAFMLIGIGLLVFDAGSSPLVPLSLSFSFGFYGLFRKLTPVPPLEALAIETAILLPFALLYFAITRWHQGFAISPIQTSDVLIMALGIATVTPLLLFAAATHRLSLSTMGLMQYITPTIQFILALTYFGEPFNLIRMIVFALIWCGLIFYTVTSIHQHRRFKAAEVVEPVG